MNDTVFRFETTIDLRLPGAHTFEQCPEALRALNAAYGWPGGDAPIPHGLEEATHAARGTHRWGVRATLLRSGSIVLDNPYIATAERLEGALIERDRELAEAREKLASFERIAEIQGAIIEATRALLRGEDPKPDLPGRWLPLWEELRRGLLAGREDRGRTIDEPPHAIRTDPLPGETGPRVDFGVDTRDAWIRGSASGGVPRRGPPPRFDIDRAWTSSDLDVFEAELRVYWGEGHEPPEDLALIAAARGLAEMRERG